MHAWRLTLVAGAGMLAAAAGTVLAVALNVATGGTAHWFPAVDRYPLWWTAGATVGVAGAGMMLWRVQAWYDRSLAELVPAVEQLQAWVVERPDEVNEVVAALRRRSGGTVGITTAVQGAGGFGKTTIAKMVRADRRVLRWFGGRVYWVTVGRDAGRQALPGLVNGLIAQLEPDRAVTFTDARQAAGYLAAVLAKGRRRRRRVLLVLDDVWTEEQLAAFPVAERCARLVTTRIPSLTAGTSVPVRVDQMSEVQARALLLAGLRQLPPAVVVAGLVKETGRWPLLLRLVNKIIVGQASLEPDVGAVAADLLGRLRTGGPLEVDKLTEAAGKQLDVADPDQRGKAVQATILASTGLLGKAEQERLAELAVFAEDETIPVLLITALWQATGGLDPIAGRALCARLADLALLSPAPGGGTVTMHGVIREYLREDIGASRLEDLHQVLLDTAAKGLPAAAGPGMAPAWWELPEGDRYLREHLIEHLIAAGQPGEAEGTAEDLRWAGARLQMAGPAGPSADLALVGTPRAERLRQLLGKAAHLLGPTDPPHSQLDILYSWVSHDPDWGPQARALAACRPLPALASRWPLPDLPSPALRHILTGHTDWVAAVAVSTDGTWLATACEDGTARIWDAATGQLRATLTGHTDHVRAVAIAPDGTWLATASDDRTARIWDAATGQLRATLTGHSGWVAAVAIAPDGTWLATASNDRSARIWDAATGQQRGELTGHTSWVAAVAVSADGTWLATASDDATVRIWDAATGQLRATLAGHTDYVTAVAIAPDGTWLTTASWDQTTRIWDAATGQQRAILTGHTDHVRAVAVAPDGTWLATASNDRTVRIWDAATGGQRATLVGHTSWVMAVAVAADGTWLATASGDRTARIWNSTAGQLEAALAGTLRYVSSVTFAPDGTWLAAASDDGTARIWDAATGGQRATLAGHTDQVRAVAVAADGSWLATASGDGTARIWDAATGQLRATLAGHTDYVRAVAIGPDGSWLATASDDGTARIWDAATGQLRATLAGHTDYVRAVAIGPDGSWLATASDDGTARIWDAATGQLRATLAGHTDYVTAVAIGPDGSWLATASDDETARIWDAATGQQRATLAGHTDYLTAVAIAPDGSWLATASNDRTVRIWDAATGQQRATLTGHTDQVRAVAVAPDGTWLATASGDQTARIWDPATGGISALMRVEQPLGDCSWSPSGHLLSVAGNAGLYLFAFNS